MGYRGGITVALDLAREPRPRAARQVFLTLTHAPGDIAQVDWADFGFAPPGSPRRVSAFVMVLAYTRVLHLEFTLSQSQGSLLRCMERACRFYGGIIHVDVVDNMRTVVLEHKTTPVLHPRFVHHAAARGFAITACRPTTPTGKPDVERGIGFVRERFWPGRRFASLMDLNRQAISWRDDFANAPVHETTGKVPSLVFEHEEKKCLSPVADAPFDTDDLFGTGVTKSFRVSFDLNRYSVPPRLVSQSVVVRGSDDFVHVFLATKEVAVHPRSWGIGEDIELPTHRRAALATKQCPDSSALPTALEGLGETGRTYARLFAAFSRSMQREMVRIVFLVELFGASATKSAIDEVMKTGHIGAEYVEYVLRHKRRLVPAPAPRSARSRRALSRRARSVHLRSVVRHAQDVRPGGSVVTKSRSGDDTKPPADDDAIELLVQKLRWLRLPGMVAAVREWLAKAAAENLSCTDVVSRLCDKNKAESSSLNCRTPCPRRALPRDQHD
jgi:hypothetical protein